MIRDSYDAVLLDRDGTLVHNVPYNGDPAMVRPMPGAVEAVARLRAMGLKLGVVSNQSGLARGAFTQAQLAAVHARINELLGPFDTWQVCPHDEAAGCPCRKPRPGLVLAAAAALGVSPQRCLVVGDIGSDVVAAQAAGATGVLVPTVDTRDAEVAAAPLVRPDLPAVVAWLAGAGPVTPLPATGRAVARAPRGRVLAVRADSAGDLLLTGPAIRAVAHGSTHVTLLVGPRGRAVAPLLPGVDEIIEWAVPWLDPTPDGVDPDAVAALVKQLQQAELDRAVIFTSFHQSPLPTALLARLAGIGHVSAISEDYPGALLDVRHRVSDDLPETQRALSLARAAGFALPDGDDGRLRVGPLPDVRALTGPGPYVVVHPGTSVPARACPPAICAAIVTALRRAGHRVLVTGDGTDAALTSYVAGLDGTDLGGRTDLAQLGAVLAGADCVVVGNTGPAHLAAAVGTPVVSLFAPTVPFERWGPYGVPTIRLGDASAPCRDTRAVLCPVPGHPCLSTLDPGDVVTAVDRLTAEAPCES